MYVAYLMEQEMRARQADVARGVSGGGQRLAVRVSRAKRRVVLPRPTVTRRGVVPAVPCARAADVAKAVC